MLCEAKCTSVAGMERSEDRQGSSSVVLSVQAQGFALGSSSMRVTVEVIWQQKAGWFLKGLQ